MTAPTVFATGVNKILTINPESTFGVKGSGAGQQLRRVSSDMNLTVAAIESQEILPSQQVRDARHGPRQVSGSINGQFSPGTYTLLLTNLLRNSFSAGASMAGITDAVLAVDSSGLFANVTSATANFVTGGLVKGDIMRISGETGGPAINNGEDFVILSLVPGGMTLAPVTGGAIVGFASGQTIGITAAKKLIMGIQPSSSFSIEHWYSDVARSELFLGCKVSSLSLNLPSSGYVQMQASITGQDCGFAGTQAFATPTVVTTTNGVTSSGGLVTYGAASLAYISQASIQVSSDLQASPVIGSNVVPQIFPGTMRVRGSISCYMAADTMEADFLAEAEVSLGFALTTSPAANADFVNVFIPRVKLMASNKTDGDKAIMRSYNFVGLEALPGSYTPGDTSIVIQDSTL